MEQPSESLSGLRFPLRGYERAFTLADHGSVKTSYVMAIQGSNSALAALITHLPQALVLTFNRHPRMRATQVRCEFATAEKKLLEIRVIPQDNAHGVELRADAQVRGRARQETLQRAARRH